VKQGFKHENEDYNDGKRYSENGAWGFEPGTSGDNNRLISSISPFLNGNISRQLFIVKIS